MVECDEIVLDRNIWESAKDGDTVAKAKIAADITGVVLYVHALYMGPGDWVTVSAREVCSVLGDRLTLTIGMD